MQIKLGSGVVQDQRSMLSSKLEKYIKEIILIVLKGFIIVPAKYLVRVDKTRMRYI